MDSANPELTLWDQGDILVISVATVRSRGMRQGIRRYVGLPQDVSDLVVIFLEVGMPAGSLSV